MFSVRQRSEASFLGTHAQVRETNCLDGCDRSRGQEPLRAGGGPLAAFKRRLQANARADAHLAGLAKAMTSTPEIAIEVVRIDLQLVCFWTATSGRRQRRPLSARPTELRLSVATVGTNAIEEMGATVNHSVCRLFVMVCN